MGTNLEKTEDILNFFLEEVVSTSVGQWLVSPEVTAFCDKSREESLIEKQK